MNSKNTKLKTIEIYSVLVTDIATATIAYFVAHFLKFGTLKFVYMPEMYTTFLLIILLASVLYTIVVDTSRDFTKRGYLVEFAAITKYVLSITVVVAMLLFMLQYAKDYSRKMYGIFIVVLEILTYVSHIIVKKYIRKYYSAEKNQTRLLIVTDSNSKSEVEQMMKNNLDVMTGIAGWVIWDGEETDELGNRSNYKENVKLLPIDEVFVFLPFEGRKEVADMIAYFERMGVVCNYGIDVARMYDSGGIVDNLAGYTVISYSRNRIDYNKRMIKRMMDIAGGIVGAIITIILFPFIALAIEIDDPGPVLFKQKRVGKNGRNFSIYKFRSMYKDAEKRKAQLQDKNEMDGLMFKVENDPRVTKVGAFLRKTSLDEFPQFFNILKGDMSLVGTRPPTLDEYEQYDAHYKRRLSMKPGLTGMWQVSGRSDIKNFDEVVKLDLEYIDNWSMSLDIKIIFKTLGAVMARKGAK